MRRNLLIFLVTALVILSFFAICLQSTTAQYDVKAGFEPQIAPYAGNVTVYSDGSVSASGVFQHSGDTYTLLTDVTGTITFERNNSILNGNGFTLSGNGYYALKSNNVSGITIENLAITDFSYGIWMNSASSVLIDNVTIHSLASSLRDLVRITYSGNVTVENSNITLGNVASSLASGIDAEFDSSVNVLYNSFSTNASYSGDVVYVYAFNSFNAIGNIVNSTNMNFDGFRAIDGNSALFSHNRITYLEGPIYTSYVNSVTTQYNSLNRTYGASVNYADIFQSSHDTILNSSNSAISLNSVSTGDIQYGYFDNYSVNGGVSINTAGNVTISNSDFVNTTHSAQYGGVSAQYAVGLNLYNDSIYAGASSYAVYLSYMSGQVNMENDYLQASPSGYAVEDQNSSFLNLENSYVNDTSGIEFASGTSILGSDVTGNYFNLSSSGNAFSDTGGDLSYNVNFSNNQVISPDNVWGNFGVRLLSNGMAENITVSDNNITNMNNPIYVYADGNYGINALVENNTIENSGVSIDVYQYYNTVVTGNTIINTSEIGVWVDAGGATGTIVSHNTVENLTAGLFGFGVAYNIQNLGSGASNVISYNTATLNGSTILGIAVGNSLNVLVYGNTVSGGEYDLYLQQNTFSSVFDNAVTNASTGIYSESDTNFNYYGNVVTNTSLSISSTADANGSIYANTFVDRQTNLAPLSYINLSQYNGIEFYHNNFINDTAGSSISNSFGNPVGSVFMNEPLPVGGNYWSNYTGTGTNGIGSSPMTVASGIQDMYPLLYRWTSPTLTFVETGLPAGMAWSVTVGGSLHSSRSQSMVLGQTDGQYGTIAYSVQEIGGYTASVTSGTVNLEGSSSVVTINFAPVTYAVTFTESVLPSGTPWSVTFNGVTETSASTSISFTAPNGTYSYTIGTVSGYTVPAASGSVTVNGGPQSVAVQFSPVLHTLTIGQVGLPSGDTWTVTVGGTNYSSHGSSITLQLDAGTYNITVAGVAGYTVSLPANNVTIGGSNQTFNVTFSSTTGSGGIGALAVSIGISATAIVGIVAGYLAKQFDVVGEILKRIPK